MPDTRSIVDALVLHLGESLGTMTGTAVRTMPAAGVTTVEWQVEIEAGGPAVGTVLIGLEHEGATRLATATLGDPRLVAESDIADTLRELLVQAAEAHVAASGQGLTLKVLPPAPAALTAPADAQVFDLMIGADAPIRLAGWGRVLPAMLDGARAAASDTTAPEGTAPVSTASRAAYPPPASSVMSPRNLDVVLDIELPITVRFGETQMTLEGLAKLGPGSMIDLERSPDDPVDLLVNGHLVARGQVVVVAGCYGVRVNEVVSPADRLRSLEL